MTITQQQFYLLWDIEDLKYAAQQAALNNIPIQTTQHWMRIRHAKIHTGFVLRHNFNKYPNIQIKRKGRSSRTNLH